MEDDSIIDESMVVITLPGEVAQIIKQVCIIFELHTRMLFALL